MSFNGDFVRGVVFGCCILISVILGASLAGFGHFDFDYGDIPTWLAGIGTVLTFVFLILQNLSMQKSQKLRDIEDSRLKNVQYLEHRKKNLYSLFDELKEETDIPVSFSGKYSLYRKIHPVSDITNDNFTHPSSSFITELKQDVGNLQSCLNNLDKNEREVRNIADLFHSLAKIQELLQFELSGTNLVKDLRSNHNIANIFYLTKTLDTYYQVLSTFNTECSLNADFCRFVVSEAASRKIERLFFRQGGVGGYDLGVPPYARRIVRIFYSIYELAFDADGNDPRIDDYNQLLSLMHMFVREEDFWYLVNKKSNLIQLIDTHIEELDYQKSILSDPTENSEPDISLLTTLRNLQKDLKKEKKSLETEISRSNIECP